MIKSQEQILSDLIADFIASQNKVTYSGIDGVARAILFADSNIKSEIWNDLSQSVRKAFVDTAKGSDLDTLGRRVGLPRNGATQNSAVLIFNGPNGSIIPINTIVKSNQTGTQYQTTEAVTIGYMNPAIQQPITAPSIADIVVAESLDFGSKTKVGVGELTQFQTPIAGVTVTNPFPSSGGGDAESDDQYRKRIITYIATMNQGTQAFYEALAQVADNTVYAALAQYDQINLGTLLYLIKNSYASYSNLQLATIGNAIYTKQRALMPVMCVNAGILANVVAFTYERDSTVSQSTIYSDLASQLANYVQNNFGFGAVIKYQDILDMIISTNGVKRLNIASLTLNGLVADAICSATQVPRLTGLSLNDGISTITNSIYQVIAS